MTTRTLLTVMSGILLLVVTSVAPPVIRALGPQNRVQSQETSAEDARIRRSRDDAYDTGGLRAAAAVTGSFVQTVSGHSGNTANSLEFLVKHSDVIVVGEVVANRSWLNASGDEITTDYEVFVEQSFKGPSRPADHLTMSVVGGRVGFENGSWAEVRVKDMALPLNGERYVLFLKATNHQPGPEQRKVAKGAIYTPSFDSLSLYRVSKLGIVTPKVYSGHPLFKAYAGKSERNLLDGIVEVAERQKERDR